MATWPSVRLGDHVDLLTGYPFRSRYFLDGPSGIRIIKGSNVSQGTIDWNGTKRWPEDRVEGLEKYALEEGDVLLAMDRPWVTAGLKYAWITRRDLPALLVQRVARMRGRNGLLTAFLRYVIGSKSFEGYIEPIVTGVNVPHISPSQIEAFRFELPPVEEQERIVSILQPYDELIETNGRRVEVLEETIHSIYREWFETLHPPSSETDVGTPVPDGLPAGWRMGDLTDVIEVDPFTPRPASGLHPFIPMPSLAPGTMLVSSIEQRATGSGLTRFLRNDTLFAGINPSLQNGKTAFAGFLREDEIGLGSTELIVLRSKTASPEWVYCLARTERLRETAIRSMTGASGRQRVRKETLKSFRLAIPPQEVLDAFSASTRPYFEMLEVLRRQIEVLHRVRSLLLPHLLSREIELSELDIDTSWIAA